MRGDFMPVSPFFFDIQVEIHLRTWQFKMRVHFGMDLNEGYEFVKPHLLFYKRKTHMKTHLRMKKTLR